MAKDSGNQAIRPLNKKFSGRRLFESGIKGTTLLCALVSILTTAGIVYVLLTDAFGFFNAEGVSLWQFLTGGVWQPEAREPLYGIWPLLSGTLMIALGSAVIALPLGLLTAIFLAEYASKRVRAILKPALELLAGVPTVVYGYFAIYAITPILQSIGNRFGFNVDAFNAASGAIVVGVMTLPLVSSLCEDAISSVPRDLKGAAYGLGSTKFEVTKIVTIRAALSGIVASFILAVSRAIGETMAVTLAAGSNAKLTMNPFESIQTMTAYIVQVSKGDVSRGDAQYMTIFAVGASLFVMTLAMNILAQRVVRKYRLVQA